MVVTALRTGVVTAMVVVVMMTLLVARIPWLHGAVMVQGRKPQLGTWGYLCSMCVCASLSHPARATTIMQCVCVHGAVVDEGALMIHLANLLCRKCC